MAGQDITYDDVAAAARNLEQNGSPVTVGALREVLGGSSVQAIHPHLSAWRTAQAQMAEAPPPVAVPAAITSALNDWARQLAEEVAVRQREGQAQTEGDVASLLQMNEQAEAERDELRARLAEREASIERLTVELRHARDIASDALVGKAKDQLAIEGKDAQLAELRRQLERQVALSAAESDARLNAEMELVGATTARDNHAAEIASLRAQLDAARAAA